MSETPICHREHVYDFVNVHTDIATDTYFLNNSEYGFVIYLLLEVTNVFSPCSKSLVTSFLYFRLQEMDAVATIIFAELY